MKSVVHKHTHVGKVWNDFVWQAWLLKTDRVTVTPAGKNSALNEEKRKKPTLLGSLKQNYNTVATFFSKYRPEFNITVSFLNYFCHGGVTFQQKNTKCDWIFCYNCTINRN